MSIIVEKLSKMFGEQRAVDNISFVLQPGEIVGFLGPNGAGKSTTMRMLTTYLAPSGGTATVVGMSIYEQPEDIKRQIGYLPESNPLYYDMYVREYLTLAAKVQGVKANVKARVDEVVAQTGLTKEVKKKIGALSKGYKQRVGLAQAIIHHPAVLIMDEPTTGLDPNQLSEIRNLITTIAKDKTVLLSTHIMQEVEAMCQRVIIINEGKIVKDEPMGNVAKSSAAEVLEVIFENSSAVSALQNAYPQYSYTSLGKDGVLIAGALVEELQKAAMRFSLEQDFPIVSIRKQGSSLEEVFRKATGK